MKLYYAPGACSLAPHIVAREAGLQFDLARVDIQGGYRVDDGSDYLAVNPRGYVPALMLDDGSVHTEASVLVQYLADLAPASGLMPPAGTIARLRVQEWLAFVSTELHKTFSWLWHKDTAASTQTTAKEKLKRRFAELDHLLGDQDYLTGGTFTAADAYLFTVTNWANFLALDLTAFPNLQAFLARVGNRAAVRTALRAEGLID